MISQSEYLAAKSIVDAYEAQEWEEGHRLADEELSEDLFEDDEDYDDICGLASNCHYGAYRMTERGYVCVSDCIC